MALKLLLVAFTTNRKNDDGVVKRVRFPAKSVVNLTDDELDLLDRLTQATGKLHYRAPVQEGGKVEESKPEVEQVPDYAGQDVPVSKKSVDQLKAFLTFHKVDFEAGSNKTALLALAEGVKDDDDDSDPDGGL